MAVAKERWSQDKSRGCRDPGFWSGAGVWGHVERAVAAGQAKGPVPTPLLPWKTFRKKFSGFDLRLLGSKVSANGSHLRTPRTCAAPFGSAFPQARLFRVPTCPVTVGTPFAQPVSPRLARAKLR